MSRSARINAGDDTLGRLRFYKRVLGCRTNEDVINRALDSLHDTVRPGGAVNGLTYKGKNCETAETELDDAVTEISGYLNYILAFSLECIRSGDPDMIECGKQIRDAAHSIDSHMWCVVRMVEGDGGDA